VNAIKPPKEISIPVAPVMVIGMPKIMEVITIANIRRIQFKAA
jgi:hypothetical protein